MLDDKKATKRLKSFRHTIYDIVSDSCISKALLLGSRNTKEDVGKDSCLLEGKEGWQEILFANSQRVKESLRVLEEFFKLIDKDTSRRFKSLRFRFYDFEKRSLMGSKVLPYTKHHSRRKP
jgi:hypothetical protein